MKSFLSHRTNQQLLVGMAILVAWAIFLLALHNGIEQIRVETLGQFGDAFAPMTALFAVIAAVGAYSSYDAQRQQLEDERARSRMQRFDELFFRWLDSYERTIDTVVHRYMSSNDRVPHERTMRDGLLNVAHSLLHPELSDQRSIVVRWREQLDWNIRIAALSTEIPAFLRLLQAFADEQISSHGELLAARLTAHELIFWQYSIAMTDDEQLIKFAARMRLYGAGKGMTEEEAVGVAASSCDRGVAASTA